MDPNSTPTTTTTNATDSLSVISSLVSSLSQLEMVPVTGDAGGAPINRMPNELMQHILAKLALDGDGNQLVRLRLVSRRWNSLVEYHCQKKKCLFVNCDCDYKPDLDFSVSLIVYLNSIESFGTILSLFLNTEKLTVRNYRGFYSSLPEDTQLRNIAGHLNSLSSLKQLQLYGLVVRALPYMSQTLSQLEHLALDGYIHILDDDAVLDVVSHLGPRCVRVNFGGDELIDFQLALEWPTINPHWLANLTHLQMVVYGNQGFGEFVHSLGEHATALKSLNLTNGNANHFQMRLSVFRDLGALVHLSELKLWGIELDIAVLDDAATQRQLRTLPAVLTCGFYLVDGPKLVNADAFSRVLSVIFPNLTKFILKVKLKRHLRESTLRGIEHNLDRFSKLQKHTIEYAY